jgi:hypothetical protein
LNAIKIELPLLPSSPDVNVFAAFGRRFFFPVPTRTRHSLTPDT